MYCGFEGGAWNIQAGRLQRFRCCSGFLALDSNGNPHLCIMGRLGIVLAGTA
jgi:hypothetical protein